MYLTDILPCPREICYLGARRSKLQIVSFGDWKTLSRYECHEFRETDEIKEVGGFEFILVIFILLRALVIEICKTTM